MGALQLEFISSLDNVFKSSNMMVYIVKSLVYASGQCMEQRSCGCSKLWHSAPPGMAVDQHPITGWFATVSLTPAEVY